MQAQVSVSSVAAEVAAPVVPARTPQSVLFRAVAPFVIGGAVLLVPTPEGLTVNAWRFFALFLATITGVIAEPIPGAAVGLLGVSIAAVLFIIQQSKGGVLRRRLRAFGTGRQSATQCQQQQHRPGHRRPPAHAPAPHRCLAIGQVASTRPPRTTWN